MRPERKGGAQRAHRLLAVHARRCPHLRALEPGPPVRAQVDEATEHVEEVRAELLQARQALIGDPPGLRPDEPHEHAEQRHRRREQDRAQGVGEEDRDEHDDGGHRRDRPPARNRPT